MVIFFNFSLPSNNLYPLQVENCDSNSRLVVDEDDNRKLRLERVKNEKKPSVSMVYTQIFQRLIKMAQITLSNYFEKSSPALKGWMPRISGICADNFMLPAPIHSGLSVSARYQFILPLLHMYITIYTPLSTSMVA